jgi:acetyl-CoA carboxylase biotin carboxyl carrier protein
MAYKELLVADRKLSYQDLLEIIRLVEESPEFSEFKLEYGDIKINLGKSSAGAISAHEPLDNPADLSPKVTQVTSPPEPVKLVRSSRTSVPDGMIGIKSPMVGSFYRSPEPGAPPFIEIGSTVNPDSTVCIIEVMKLMNSLPAGVNGTISEILVADGDPVEYGQILVLIKPS